MGMYDTIEGVPKGYDDQVKLWDCELREYRLGDVVPSVGDVATYSVRLHEGREATVPRYVRVVDGVIAGIGELEPVAGSPVFSKWGGPEEEEHPFAVFAREQGSG